MRQRDFRFPKAAPSPSRILLCICMCCLPVVVEVSTPVSALVISVVVLSVSTGLPAARSLSLSTLHWPGHKTSVDVVVEEGGPRIGAKRRGGDPLPRGQCQSQFSTASGQQGRLGWSAYRGPPQTTTLGASDALHQTTAPSDPPPKPTHSQMNHLPASSRNPAGSRVRAAAHERLSGRSRSLRVDRSTIKSPTPGPGPCTQIRQGVRGAITIGSRPTRNHSPPRAQSPMVRRRHDVQIRRGPPSSGQLQSQISTASGQQGLRIGGRLMNEDPTDPPSEDPQGEDRR